MIRIRQEITKNGNPIYYFELDNGGQNLTWSDWVDVFWRIVDAHQRFNFFGCRFQAIHGWSN